MTLAAGARVGPYEVLGPIGAGGMGEVWRARDGRLGREVALKLLPAEVAADPDRLRRFEQEARATAALSHPNILAIHDVGSHEGVPYLVEELLEGETLSGRIHAGDMTVGRAVALALQVARGLAAAHERGVVHRDLKPDNVFVTRDGVVKILDFGLAKLSEGRPLPELETVTDGPRPSETGLVVGTPAYMAPEQARGKLVDHRADLFAFGVVLYEMLAGVRPFAGDSHADLVASILTRDPPPLPQSVPRALHGVVSRCLEKRPEDRFSTARDVAYALEAALESTPARVMEQKREEPRPYPGLASFTEGDSERFFGREEEVAALWRKLPERKLLALIGPSGAGKTSFVRAGLVAHAPPRWRCLVATPGQSPFAGLARALAPHFAGDAEVVQQLIEFHKPEVGPALVARWAEGCDGALVVVDQAEELFTQSGEEVQGRFAELLGRLAELPGIHVLLSLRDDFLIRCNAYTSLRGVFESLTPLVAPEGDALRRALVEPATRLGFAFEDEALVDDMLRAVEGERGALPLLAFAVSRLWEERDRERKLLTREAYASIGGVAGALAQHAETTLERLGEGSVPLVRELFRNLATGEQTRCVLEWDELLSVFPEDQRGEAERVLAALVDARLLTSFELEGADGTWRHRVEVVHESLLRSWPRLVRWQAQDEEGALLRDQLRQAARLWQERGRPEDLLWSGNAVTEYSLWRERYPGGLSAVEEAFGDAMVEVAGRRRRTRRLLVTSAVAALSLGLSVTGVLWRRSVSETRHREAAQLLALGQVKLADSPNAALAFAIASLERADNEAARRFAVEALAQGPPALFLTDPVPFWNLAWSPDSRWLALGGHNGLELVDRDTGDRRRLSTVITHNSWPRGFTADGRHFVRPTIDSDGALVWDVWSIPEGRLEHTINHPARTRLWLAGEGLLGLQWDEGTPGRRPGTVRRVGLDGTLGEVIGRFEPQALNEGTAVDAAGRWLLSLQGGRLIQHRLDQLASPPRELGTYTGQVSLRVGPWSDWAVLSNTGGEVRVWDLPSGRLIHAFTSPADARATALDPGGRFLATAPFDQVLRPRSMFLFDLEAPATAEPVPLLESSVVYINDIVFSPDGSWLATCHGTMALLWNMTGSRSVVVGRAEMPYVAFADDGHLLTGAFDGVLRRWPLQPGAVGEVEEVWSRPGVHIAYLDVVRARRTVALGDEVSWGVFVVPLDHADDSRPEPERFPLEAGFQSGGGAVDPSGSLLAFNVRVWGQPEPKEIRVVDLETGAERTLDTRPVGGEGCYEAEREGYGDTLPFWLPDGRLLSDGDGGVREWDLSTGSSRQLIPCRRNRFCFLATPDSRTLVCTFWGEDRPTTTTPVMVADLASGTTRDLGSHGNRVGPVALDPTGTILVTGDRDGVIRVGPLTGEEPHLLFGHTGAVRSVAVSPDGRRIASAGADGTIRLWPMPDLSRPPLHTLPYAELLAKLKSLTNLRAVPDPAAGSGWKTEIGPFPGWAEVPEWQP